MAIFEPVTPQSLSTGQELLSEGAYQDLSWSLEMRELMQTCHAYDNSGVTSAWGSSFPVNNMASDQNQDRVIEDHILSTPHANVLNIEQNIQSNSDDSIPDWTINMAFPDFNPYLYRVNIEQNKTSPVYSSNWQSLWWMQPQMESFQTEQHLTVGWMAPWHLRSGHNNTSDSPAQANDGSEAGTSGSENQGGAERQDSVENHEDKTKDEQVINIKYEVDPSLIITLNDEVVDDIGDIDHDHPDLFIDESNSGSGDNAIDLSAKRLKTTMPKGGVYSTKFEVSQDPNTFKMSISRRPANNQGGKGTVADDVNVGAGTSGVQSVVQPIKLYRKRKPAAANNAIPNMLPEYALPEGMVRTSHVEHDWLVENRIISNIQAQK